MVVVVLQISIQRIGQNLKFTMHESFPYSVPPYQIKKMSGQIHGNVVTN